MTVYVVALAAEARPIIDQLKLKRIVDKPWPTYSNGSEYLILTGVGQLNAAAACGWLFGYSPHLARVPWLNVGVAGHATHTLGDMYWVERLQSTRGNHYPALHCANSLPGAALQTVEAPCSDYPENHLVDMEGLAFYSTCARFVPMELLHLVKVISDNRSNPLETFDKAKVSGLINMNMDQILSFSSALGELAENLPEAAPEGIDDCVLNYSKLWRFSHNQNQQLFKLLSRFYTLTNMLWEPTHFKQQPRDAKQVLAMLKVEITELPVVMQ